MARRKKLPQVKKALALLVLLPLAAWGVVRCGPLLERLAARAALFSACLNMPEGSIAMLRERFAEELAPAPDTAPPAPAAPAAPPPAKPPAGSSSEAPAQSSRPAQSGKPEEEGLLPEPESVPKKYRGEIKEVRYEADGSPLYLPLKAGFLKNSTKLKNSAVQRELEKPPELTLKRTDAPQVLIIHTHATEAYERYDVDFYDTRSTWRDTDDSCNMIPVGDEIAAQLEDAGIGVIHDTTQHDYPSYNGAYERSAETVRGWLAKYPTIQVVLDVHRDAIQPESDVIVKSVAEIDGKRAAQVMIITGCDDGTMNVPDWAENLRFAAALQTSAETLYPGLMRPVFFCYRKYNMDLTTGSILLEFGSHGNTPEQAKYSGQLVGKALVHALRQVQK